IPIRTRRSSASRTCISGSRSWTGLMTIRRNRTSPNSKRFRLHGSKNSTMSRGALRAAVLMTALTAVISAQAPRRPVRTHSGAAAEPAGLTPEMRIVVGHITANSLRGDVSFLASDLLEGRDTPSRGLDIAGEYIAAQFRRLGLEPAGDDGYFQSVVLRPEDADSPKSRNVAGILRGSDPKLKDTYVILSSHYDHIGMAQTGEDRIFNGANDDASG